MDADGNKGEVATECALVRSFCFIDFALYFYFNLN